MTEVMDEEDVEVFCPNCGATVDDGEDGLTNVGFDHTGCPDCAHSCDNCGNTRWTEDMQWIRANLLCEECYRYCDGCGDYFNEADTCEDGWGSVFCESCHAENDDSYGDGTIRSYGHTEAIEWYKTDEDRAKPREERYYLGVELEIGTGNLTAAPIMDWAARHFGSAEAIIGKEDSSVDGFEICTQPMTPAYFEQTNWEDFFQMLNRNYPLEGEESTGHGLHVHIGRVAFRSLKGEKNDDWMVAAYAYLLSQSDHLERIARRQPTGYCNKVHKPVSVSLVASGKQNKQVERLRTMGLYPGRDAINLGNPATIEIRAFRSTRSAREFRDAVRVVYTAAEYVRSLRASKTGMSGNALHWSEFARWVGINYPEAFPNISGLAKK